MTCISTFQLLYLLNYCVYLLIFCLEYSKLLFLKFNSYHWIFSLIICYLENFDKTLFFNIFRTFSNHHPYRLLQLNFNLLFFFECQWFLKKTDFLLEVRKFSFPALWFVKIIALTFIFQILKILLFLLVYYHKSIERILCPFFVK